MGKIMDTMDTFVESIDSVLDSYADKIENLFVYCVCRKMIENNYILSKKRYEYLRSNGKNVPEELKFICSLKKRDAMSFIFTLYDELNGFYYPGKNSGLFLPSADKKYEEVKKEFLSKRPHIKFNELPEDIIVEENKNKKVAVYIFANPLHEELSTTSEKAIVTPINGVSRTRSNK